MTRIIFHRTAGLVRELTEIHFECVRRRAEHVDIRPGAKDPRLKTRDHDGAHLRIFKADARNRVGEFNIHAQVVGVKFELVAFGERLILLHVHREGGDRAVYRKLPMFVGFGRSLKVDHTEKRRVRFFIAVRTFVR